METLKQNKTETLLLSIITVIMMVFTLGLNAQSSEVEFDVYTNSAAKASRYLLADDVAMRECASTNCEQLTTINIGTNVRLLAKSKTPQTINGITSRWYKVKLGPETGWIWGGLIAQKTMTSYVDPEVKFVFGEAGLDKNGKQRFQIRAIKHGEEIDKITVTSAGLSYKTVGLINNKNTDVISLSQTKTGANTKNAYVVFINDKLSETSAFVNNTPKNSIPKYASTYASEN